jgi:hypothetical protein
VDLAAVETVGRRRCGLAAALTNVWEILAAYRHQVQILRLWFKERAAGTFIGGLL